MKSLDLISFLKMSMSNFSTRRINTLLDALGAPARYLEIGVETPAGRDHRVTPRVAERGTLAAAVTYACHRERS